MPVVRPGRKGNAQGCIIDESCEVAERGTRWPGRRQGGR